MNKNKNYKTCEYDSRVQLFSFSLVIRIASYPGQNVLSDVKRLCNCFKESVFLYEQGYCKLFLNPSIKITKLLNDSIEKSSNKFKLENIGYWSSFYDTFLVHTKSDRELSVLTREQKTESIFNFFKEELSPKVVSIKLVDILQSSRYCLTIDRQCKKQILKDFDISDKDVNVTSENSQENFEGKREFNPDVKISLKCMRKIVSPTFTAPSSVLIPLTKEIPVNEHYPQQVSDEQDIDDRSSFLFSNGLSVPVTTDNIASHGRNVSSHYEQNTLTGETSSYPNNSAISAGTGNSSYSAHGARYPEYIQFHKRLASYARWIHSNPDPNTLSKAGFFYTNDADLVRCYQCGIGLKDFCQEDDPLKEHVKYSGNCPYLVEAIGEERLGEWKRLLQAQDPEYNRRMQWENRHNLPASAFTYRHPEYQAREKRLETFANWPDQMTQRPAQLADAGLYYTGFEDHVRCFACDGGLRRWDPDDDPWTEHCRWFPACPFAREIKGDDYIALVQASVNLNNEGEASESLGQDISEEMEQMTLRDPEIRAELDQHKDACVAMGFEIEEFNEAVQEIRNRGTIKPTIDEIVDVIEVVQRRKQQDSSRDTGQNETPLEQNQRLKSYVICMECQRNDVNALFLPCTHHRLCMKCAVEKSNCPVCGKYIRQKIRTYMV